MMKRILALFGVVLVLASALSVSAFAETPCAHTNAVWSPVEGDSEKHGLWCSDCNSYVGEPEPHGNSVCVDLGDGTHYYECAVCQAQMSDVLEHDLCYDTKILDTALCGGYGWKTDLYCTSCSYVGEPYQYDSEFAAHNFSNGNYCVICGAYADAVCSHDLTSYVDRGDGTHVLSCSRCLVSIGSPSSHVWGSGKVIQQPTPDANGVRQFACQICYATKTETIDYIDFEKLLENMTPEEATELYKKIFDKYKDGFVKDSNFALPYVEEFVNVALPDIHLNGARSQYYKMYGSFYNTIVNLIGTTSYEYVKGFNDAIGTVVKENPVQGLFQGMWSGIAVFYSTLTNGITIGGVALGSIVATALAVYVVVLLMKAVNKG